MRDSAPTSQLIGDVMLTRIRVLIVIARTAQREIKYIYQRDKLGKMKVESYRHIPILSIDRVDVLE